MCVFFINGLSVLAAGKLNISAGFKKVNTLVHVFCKDKDRRDNKFYWTCNGLSGVFASIQAPGRFGCGVSMRQ